MATKFPKIPEKLEDIVREIALATRKIADLDKEIPYSERTNDPARSAHNLQPMMIGLRNETREWLRLLDQAHLEKLRAEAAAIPQAA